MKLLLMATGLILVTAVLSPLALVYTGLQPAPLVQREASATQDDVARIKALVRQHDPRRLPDGTTRTLTISERDVNLLVRAMLPLESRQGSRVSLNPGRATLHYTLQLQRGTPGRYLNLSLLIAEVSGNLSVEEMVVGDLRLPGWLFVPVIAMTDLALQATVAEYGRARETLERIEVRDGAASLTYRWDRELAKQIAKRGREVFLPAADRERALAYYQVLSAASRSVGRKASLANLLQELFVEADRRSSDGDAADENRALLLVLGTVLNRSSMHRLVGGDPADLRPGHHYVRWTLQGRGDLAQHFGISAAIAAAGGGVLADTIGVFKELDDSRGGSGFSFADLLADRAGVELATAATGDRATRVQLAMTTERLRETDFMPPIDQLPEGLMEMEFRQRYRDLDDERYGRVKGEIDTRIAQLPLHR